MFLDAGFKQKRDLLTILQKIARSDRLAVAECVEKYGDLVWSLARKSTVSKSEAEKAAREIFKDIWKCAGDYAFTKLDERVIITVIARRHLRKFTKTI